MKVPPAVAGTVVRDDGDGGRCAADDVVLGVEDVHLAAIEAQIGKVEYASGFLHCEPYAMDCIATATGVRWA